MAGNHTSGNTFEGFASPSASESGGSVSMLGSTESHFFVRLSPGRLVSRQRGVTLLEILIVVAIILTVSAFSGIAIQTGLKNARVDSGYAITVEQLRRARQIAIGERVQTVVTLTAPRTILVEKLTGGVRTTVSSTDLPNDIAFQVQSGLPTASGLTPDGFGTGVTAIDFSIDYGGGGNQIFFQPDGSAIDSVGRPNNGVVYLGRTGELTSYRAVSLYGTTGRLKGWRLMPGVGSAPVQWQ